MCEQANRLELIKEAYRLSEMRLAGEAQAASVSDQRAATFCAGALAVAGLLTGLFDPATPNYGLLISATLLLIATVVAGYALRPRDFYFPGAAYSDFAEDISGNVAVSKVLSQMGDFNDTHSHSNAKVLHDNAKLTSIAFGLAMIALLIAIITQWIV